MRNRSNKLFDHEGVNEEGRKFYRRNPNKRFKSPPAKPATGASITNHEKGKMLKAVKITDEQMAGRSLRPYFNGEGYQLRLAEAARRLTELTLPPVRKTRRFKAKGGKPARLVVDPRLRYAQVTARRIKRALDAFDQWNNPDLGAHPVEEDQSRIPYVCLGDSSENETEKRKTHPNKWMGTDIKNKRMDRAKLHVSLLNFLMPCFELGNKKGDAKHFDKKDNLFIVKEEPETEPETNAANKESETDFSEEDED